MVEIAVKRTWGRIDEADLSMIHGDRDSFTRILAQKYGYAETVAQQKVDSFIAGLQPIRRKRINLTWFRRLLQKCWGRIHVSGRR
jgi:hypothetical protein